MLKNQKGFTLIELLIVIVIIGILAGVLIAVIDPTSQQNRARDAGVQAAMNKVSLAVEGFNSAYGRAPNDIEFFGTVQNTAEAGTTCAGTAGVGDDICNFTITGNALPVLCNGANTWNGIGTDQCYYHYYRDSSGNNHFKLWAKSYGIADTWFLYDNTLGEIIECVSPVADGDAQGCT